MVERVYLNFKKNEVICMISNYLNKNNILMSNFSIIWYLYLVLIWSGVSVGGIFLLFYVYIRLYLL